MYSEFKLNGAALESGRDVSSLGRWKTALFRYTDPSKTVSDEHTKEKEDRRQVRQMFASSSRHAPLIELQHFESSQREVRQQGYQLGVQDGRQLGVQEGRDQPLAELAAPSSIYHFHFTFRDAWV